MVGQSDPALEGLFVLAAQRLVEQGATVITGGCGYMILFQKTIAAAVPVPVMMSSLMQLPLLATLIPQGCQLGALVANQHTFDRRYLIACGADELPVSVWGMAEKSEFAEVMLRQERTNLDMVRLEQETIEAARELISRCPAVACVVLECTDLAPFAASVQAAVGLPVFDITTLANFIYAAHRRSDFGRA
ncbi:hypothetical protein [Paraburkholderia aspalathi]|uniref:hypothetical protein n=1 Tax=Paraburkholderia aspalathi TaxID=1324617 RepID=UPI001FD0CA2B|nr:hypothetical protein [Paraburkholderia aspalathi]